MNIIKKSVNDGENDMQGVYLDNNATTMVAPEVVTEMLPYFSEQFGNPSSMHQFGNKVGRALSRARNQVADLLGAEFDSEIIFTSCGTEADSTAILSAIKAQPERKEIITTVVEHPAILTLCEYLEKDGYVIHRLKVNKWGQIDLTEYTNVLSDRVAVVSIMWANNETGTVFPIAEMARMAREKGVLFHTDAVQAVGKIAIDLKASGIDMLSLSGHKLHAPKGIGVLYLRRGVRYRPLLRGGHQERGRRAGTENSAAIVALGKACEMAKEFIALENDKVKKLRDKLQTGLLAAIPHCFVTGDINNRLPNTLNIAFEYIEGEAILLLLNKYGIAASSGSACTSGSLEPSHVMRAMDIPFTAAHGSLRFSFSRYNCETDVDRVIEVMPSVVKQLRELSPYWENGGPVSDPEKLFDPAYA